MTGDDDAPENAANDKHCCGSLFQYYLFPLSLLCSRVLFVFLHSIFIIFFFFFEKGVFSPRFCRISGIENDQVSEKQNHAKAAQLMSPSSAQSFLQAKPTRYKMCARIVGFFRPLRVLEKCISLT